MKNKLLLIYCWAIRMALFIFPDIPFIMRFRGWLYGLAMIRCGKNVQVTHDAIVKDLQNLSLSDNIFVGNQSVILGSGRIVIGKEVLIGPHCVIVSGNHKLIHGSYFNNQSSSGTILINDGAWVAANSTIAKGGILPRGSVLAANSFLNHAFDEPFSIYGGVPASLLSIREHD